MAAHSGPIHFSTAALPDRDRVPYWREVFGRQVVKVDMEPLGDRPFESEARIHVLPALTVAKIQISANQVHRTPQLIADGSDDFVFAIMIKGQAYACQGQREVQFRAGDAILWSNARPGICSYRNPIEFITLTISRNALRAHVSDPDKAALTLIPRSDVCLSLLTGYLKTITSDFDHFSPPLQALAAAHVHDLVGLTVGATQDAKAISHGRGLRAARFEAIKADVIANVSDRSLSAEALSQRQGISPGYIRTMFRDQNTCLTNFILEQRLSLTHRRLRDERFIDCPISSIAFDCGFGDLSYFNNSFRRRYGLTPSAVRKAAILERAERHAERN